MTAPIGDRNRPRSATWVAVCLGICTALLTASLAEPAVADAANFGQRKLKLGMRGKDVRVLQKSLTRLKHRTTVDGHFGKVTRRSMVALEKRQGWRPVNGKVSREEAKRIKGLINKQIAKKRQTGTSSRSHVFPIPGPHDYGSSQSRFGAPRSGHRHQGQDVFAACGERLFNAHAGVVKAKAYQGSGAGHYLIVRGNDKTDYVYMHLRKASWAGKGTKLYAGQQIGRVGDSGNASGCHLHFEMWWPPGWYTGGKPFDPYPYLKSWDSYS
jgi:murein DD-endopeptidase MepM/ murein hydrolase activator NlpD